MHIIHHYLSYYDKINGWMFFVGPLLSFLGGQKSHQTNNFSCGVQQRAPVISSGLEANGDWCDERPAQKRPGWPQSNPQNVSHLNCLSEAYWTSAVQTKSPTGARGTKSHGQNQEVIYRRLGRRHRFHILSPNSKPSFSISLSFKSNLGLRLN